MGLDGILSVKGQVRAVTTDAQGNVVADTGWVFNKVTNYAAQCIAAWLTGSNNTGYNPVKFPNYTELGTGSGTPAATDITLFAAAPATNQKCSVVQPENGFPTVAQFVTQYYGTANNAGNYTEVGLFDSDGHMFAHTMLNVVIQSGLSTTLTWNLTITPS